MLLSVQVASFGAARQVEFLFLGQQGDAPDIAQVHAHRVIEGDTLTQVETVLEFIVLVVAVV